MATSFPGGLDSLNNPSASTAMDASGYEHDLQHANANDAIEAIEAELGVNPSGAWSTVVARLDALGSWATYTPTVAQGASTNITKTVAYARWCQVGSLAFVQVELALTGAGTSGSAITVSLPVTSVAGRLCGVGHVIDSNIGNYPATMWTLTSTTVAFSRSDQPWTDFIGAAPVMALASGDYVRINVQVEVA